MTRTIRVAQSFSDFFEANIDSLFKATVYPQSRELYLLDNMIVSFHTISAIIVIAVLFFYEFKKLFEAFYFLMGILIHSRKYLPYVIYIPVKLNLGFLTAFIKLLNHQIYGMRVSNIF